MGKTARLAVISEYPLSLQNGPGFRVLLQQLGDFPRNRLRSVFLSDRRPRIDPELRNAGVEHSPVRCMGSGMVRLASLLLGFPGAIRIAFDPDTVLLLLPNSPADLALAWLFSLFRRDAIVWWMDDFVERADFSAPKQAVGRWLRARVQRRAGLRITVSTAMKAHFEVLFPDIPIDAVLGKECAEVLSRKTAVPSRPLRLAYVGSYDWPYLDPLQALKKLAERGEEFSLELFGIRPPPEELLMPGKISYQGAVADEELLARLASYDYLILAYSFDEMTRSSMRHSFPSKLVDYLGSGTPVWTISPRTLPCIDDLQRRQVGPLTLSLDEDRLKAGLHELRSADAATYIAWSKNAIGWAREEFLFRPGRFLALVEKMRPRSNP